VLGLDVGSVGRLHSAADLWPSQSLVAVDGQILWCLWRRFDECCVVTTVVI
jgi:hypothetical protein